KRLTIVDTPAKSMQSRRYQAVTPAVTKARITYLPVLAIATNRRKLQNGSRSTPAATVRASPPSGAQDRRRLQRPHLRYQIEACSSEALDTGNQLCSRNRSMPRPRAQLSTAPSVLPVAATITSHSIG